MEFDHVAKRLIALEARVKALEDAAVKQEPDLINAYNQGQTADDREVLSDAKPE